MRFQEVLKFLSFCVFLSVWAKEEIKDLSHGFGTDIEWIDFSEADEVSARLNKPVFVLIHKTWCGACKQLKKSFETSPKRKEFIQLTRKFVMVNLEDDEEPEDDKFAPDGRYIPRLYFLKGGDVLPVTNKNYPKNLYYFPQLHDVIKAMEQALKLYDEKSGTAESNDEEPKKEKREVKKDEDVKEVKEESKNEEKETEKKEKKTKDEPKKKTEEKKNTDSKNDNKKEKKEDKKKSEKTDKNKEESKKETTKDKKTEEKPKKESKKTDEKKPKKDDKKKTEESKEAKETKEKKDTKKDKKDADGECPHAKKAREEKEKKKASKSDSKSGKEEKTKKDNKEPKSTKKSEL